jgi:arginyl-tRNA synthetase
MYEYPHDIIEYIKILLNKELKKIGIVERVNLDICTNLKLKVDLVSNKLSFVFDKNSKVLRILKKRVSNLHAIKYKILFFTEKAYYLNINIGPSYYSYMFSFKKPCQNLICVNTGRILIDFSSPNISKRLHIGHVRSLVTGIFLTRILNLAGYYTIKNSHFGN